MSDAQPKAWDESGPAWRSMCCGENLLGGAGNIMRSTSPGSSFLCLVGHDVNISQLGASAAAELADATLFNNSIALS